MIDKLHHIVAAGIPTARDMCASPEIMHYWIKTLGERQPVALRLY